MHEKFGIENYDIGIITQFVRKMAKLKIKERKCAILPFHIFLTLKVLK